MTKKGGRITLSGGEPVPEEKSTEYFSPYCCNKIMPPYEIEGLSFIEASCPIPPILGDYNLTLVLHFIENYNDEESLLDYTTIEWRPAVDDEVT